MTEEILTLINKKIEHKTKDKAKYKKLNKNI